ncbi:MAG: diphthine synthase [Methanobacteriota archaeon]|nr:MAG: diphthine synthase [Euryarchaeota archaeon]
MAEKEHAGRLALVGLGLCDEKDITVRGMEEIMSADNVFAEHYTSRLKEGSISRLSNAIGKEIVMLPRKEVEEGSRIIDSCRTGRTAFLVGGDPLTATTHIDLRLRALQESIETVVVHASSVLTAVPGLLGLQHYKLGRTTTLPFPQKGYLPTSPYEIIVENLARGLHSLVLLDTNSADEGNMTANEGMEVLLDMAGKSDGLAKLDEDTLVAVVARAGAPDCVIAAGRMTDMRTRSFGLPLHTIVIPGRLHFMEEEALKAFANLRT